LLLIDLESSRCRDLCVVWIR